MTWGKLGLMFLASMVTLFLNDVVAPRVESKYRQIERAVKCQEIADAFARDAFGQEPEGMDCGRIYAYCENEYSTDGLRGFTRCVKSPRPITTAPWREREAQPHGS